MKAKIKAGDEVVVLAGNAKGARAKVLQVLPAAQRVLLENVNKRKHFERKSEQNPEGLIIEREAPIHLSNVMAAATYDSRKNRKPQAAS